MMPSNAAERKAHLVGSGIANLAAAAYLIKDGGLLGANITIYEEEAMPGGVLDAFGDPEKGYFMRGERMFEANYVCLYDLMSFIPSLDDPHKTITQDTLEYCNAYPWNNKARLVVNGKATNFESFGFNEKDQLELFALTAKPEIAANGKRIDEVFSEHFFTTNFWHMWKTLFAFNPWHSAIEMRRYLIRFMHLFPDIGRQNKIHRTRYNNYDSTCGLLEWLTKQGVRFLQKTRVTSTSVSRTALALRVTANSLVPGSGRQGKDHRGPAPRHRHRDARIDGSQRVVRFERQATGADHVCAVVRFLGALGDSLPETGRTSSAILRSTPVTSINRSSRAYTVTQNDPRFFERMEKLTGNKAGRNGITTLPDSNWVLSFILNSQPYYQNQPRMFTCGTASRSSRTRSATSSRRRRLSAPEESFWRSCCGT